MSVLHVSIANHPLIVMNALPVLSVTIVVNVIIVKIACFAITLKTKMVPNICMAKIS